MQAIEVKGSWFGVEIPSWLRAFDCRGEALATPYKGSEKAEVDLGLRSLKGESYWAHGTTPLSCQTYIDARTADEVELRRQVTDMVKEATKFKKEYDAVGNVADKGLGGSCFYLPIAICMSNFGWSILCDRRSQRVRHFQ